MKSYIEGEMSQNSGAFLLCFCLFLNNLLMTNDRDNKFEDTKWLSEAVNRRTDNTMAKRYQVVIRSRK